MQSNLASAPAGSRVDRGLARGPVGRLWSVAFAALYDPMNRAAEQAGIGEWRAELLARAAGDVLEIGAGTGANLDHYPAGIRSLTLAEPDAAMRRRLEGKLAAERRARILDARAEALPLPDGSVDTVAATYVLCSVELQPALSEIRRVLRPEGQLLFCEHVRSAEPRLARWQDRLNRPWRALACGCNCNRDTERALAGAGFEITAIERGGVDAELALVRPTIRGRAVPEGR